jgi:hypothetical protein
MTISEATDILFQRGIKVLKLNKNKYAVSYVNGQPWENYYARYSSRYKRDGVNEWTGREIIKLARAYTDSSQQTSMRKNVKKFSNDKDRAATRDAIKKEDFDKIPSNKRTKEEDRWCWD